MDQPAYTYDKASTQVFTFDEEVRIELLEALKGSWVDGIFGDLTTQEQVERIY